MTREEAIARIKDHIEVHRCHEHSAVKIFEALNMAIKALEQPEQHYDEWCTDCKEYDHERHCCPRFNRVIRETLKDCKAAQSEPEQNADALWNALSEVYNMPGLPDRVYEIVGDVMLKLHGEGEQP